MLPFCSVVNYLAYLLVPFYKFVKLVTFFGCHLSHIISSESYWSLFCLLGYLQNPGKVLGIW